MGETNITSHEKFWCSGAAVAGPSFASFDDMKKLLWTALAAVVSAGAAALALRGLNYVWQRIAHEPPPEQPKWARFIVGGPLKKGVQSSIEPTPA